MRLLQAEAFNFIETHKEEMIALWQELVDTDSGPDNKPGVDGLAAVIKNMLERDGAAVRIEKFAMAGNMVIASFGPDRKNAPIVFIGHIDTVFPKGAAKQRPFAIKDGKAYGPGVLDMKGGVVIMLYAAKALQAAGYNRRPLKIILAGDEETAHTDSDAPSIIKREAAGAVAAFNCETGFVDNRVTVGRKGGASYKMEARGVAAHTGNNPQDGRSAILELAHKVIGIHDPAHGGDDTTFNVGTIHGGMGPNTTPDYAVMEVGIRFKSEAAAQKAAERLRAMAEKTYVAGTSTALSGGVGISAMETTPGVMNLFELVAEASLENWFGRIEAVQLGGASDSAYTVQAGVPTVCSLGVKGEKNHSPQEYALVDSLYERTKLLIACVLKLDNK